MTKQEALKIINQVGEDFGWQMGKVGANYENGYMKAIRDCKAVFQKEEHIREDTKKVVTNADRIRNMTDEELAEIVMCHYEYAGRKRFCLGQTCTECSLKWLKEKVE